MFTRNIHRRFWAVIYVALAATLLASQVRADFVRECDLSASQLHSRTSIDFDPIPALSLRLEATKGTGFQLGCAFNVTDNGWFVRGIYQQTTGYIAVDLRFDPELATGRFDLHQRIVDFDIGYRAELRSDVSLLLTAGYSTSWYKPDDFLLVLPSGGAQFDHRGDLKVDEGGVTATAGIRWQAAERFGLEFHLRYRDRSAYELADDQLNSETLGRVGAAVKLTESVRLILDYAVGEQSRVSNVGLRWIF